MPVFKYRDPQTGEWINIAGGGGAGESVDAYTKEETLSEETKTTLGLGTDAVPDEAFNVLKTLVDSNTETITSGAKISTGSYKGTGTYGSSNKNMLTFDFAPKIWGLYQVDTDGSYYQQLAVMFPFKNITPTYGACVRPSGIEDTPGYWTIEVSGNTVSWWVGVNNIATYSALTQANGSNYTYYWFAIG